MGPASFSGTYSDPNIILVCIWVFMFMVSAVSVEVFPFIFLLSDVSALTLMLVGAQHSTIFIIWLVFCL